MEIGRQPIPMLPLDRRTGSRKSSWSTTRRPPCAKRGAACAAGSIRFSKAMSRTDRNAFSAAVASMCVRRIAFSSYRSTGSNFRRRAGADSGARQRNLPRGTGRCGGRGTGTITGAAMLKDETRCIRCGLCAERCPVKRHHDGSLFVKFAELLRWRREGQEIRWTPPDVTRTKSCGELHGMQPPAGVRKARRRIDRPWPGRGRPCSATNSSRRTCCMSRRRSSTPASPTAIRWDSVTQDLQSRDLHRARTARHLCALRRLHAPRMPDGMETGAGHHRVPLPWQQIHIDGVKIEGPGAAPSALAEGLGGR
jgi:ferredoxin